MKHTVVTALVITTLGQSAFAADFEDYAKVVSVAEKTERVNAPREECTKELATNPQTNTQNSAERDLGGAIIGGLAGALIGSQVGKGNGKVAGAAVGAATGAIAGDRLQNNAGANTGTQTTTRCRMVDSWQTRSLGYEVTYDFGGRRYTETLPFRPGDTLRLRVSLAPQR